MNPRDIGIYVLGLFVLFTSMPKGVTTPEQQVQLSQEQTQDLSQQINQEVGSSTTTSQSSSIRVVGASPELEITIRAEIATLPKPLQEALAMGEIRVVPEQGQITASGERAAASAYYEKSTLNGVDTIKRATKIYESGKDYFPGLLAHEGAHHLATELWGDSRPPQDYEALFKSEGGVSKYGSTSSTEDFAEAVKLFTTGELQSISPRKHAYIAKLLANK